MGQTLFWTTLTKLFVNNETRDSFDSEGERRYRFSVLAPDLYVIRTARPENEPVVDTVVRLFGEEREEIGYDDDGGEDTYSLLREPLETGEYYLSVRSYYGESGTYWLSIATEDGDAELQERRRLARFRNAGQVRIDDAPSWSELDGRRSSWRRFSIVEPAVYVVRTAQLENGPIVDTVIRLFGTDGEEIGYDDDGGDGTYSVLRERLDEGRHYLEVASYDGRNGGYLLSVAREDRDTELQAQRRRALFGSAEEVGLNEAASLGELDGQRSSWYHFTASNAGVYVVRTARPNDVP